MLTDYELLGGLRFLDTSLCDVDVQPTYVRAYVRGKVCNNASSLMLPVFLTFAKVVSLINN